MRAVRSVGAGPARSRTGTTVHAAGTNEGWPDGRLKPTVRSMNVKNLSTLLWFLAGWSGFGLLVGFTDLPTSWALLGGLATAAVVRWDPTGLLWDRPVATRRVRPIEEVAAELDVKAGVPGTVGERAPF
jgi:hypothetical protein